MINLRRKMKKTLLMVLIVIVLVGIGYMIYKNVFGNSPDDKQENQTNTPELSNTQKWQGENLAINGSYADADVIEYKTGKFRLYYSEEPEVAGFNGKVYSSVSTDGINWTKEAGIRIEMSTFPDVVKLADQTYRMYFQNAGIIKSATSADGLTWKDETGTRINEENKEGLELKNVAAPTTILLNDGTYLMVYRGTINEPYGTEKLPNKDTQLFFYATSKDGLNFEKQGVALDSRNSTLNGLLDGPDLIRWDGSTELTAGEEIRLYFWTYSGIYHVVYENGKFTSDPVFDYTNNTNSKNKFPQNPPGDPTLIKIFDTWFMYYGQHTKGIYFTKYES